MESNIVDLKEKRENVLDAMEETIDGWDGTYEAGIGIIDKIGVDIERLQKINSLIESRLGSIPYDEDYEVKLISFKNGYQVLINKLEIEKNKLFELMKETRLKDEVKGSYILKESKSIFIDKDL